MLAGKPTERGFTLIEVMIAILITVIAVVGIIAMFMTQSKASSFTRHTSEAAALATDKLEELRTTTTPTGSSQLGIDGTGKAPLAGDPPGVFERQWTVTAVAGYSDIAVRVGWDEDEAAGASCTLHTGCVSKFCRPSTSTCAGRAVVVMGRRNNQ